MAVGASGPCVVHGKFYSYLPWSQPFLYDLLRQLSLTTASIVITSQTEHLERFPTPNLFVVDTRYLVDEPFAVLAAAEARKRWQPRLLHAHFGWSGLRMVGLRQLLRVPLVTTFGGRDVGEQLASPVYSDLYRTLIEASDRIVCVSEFLRERLIDAGADERRALVIHRGVDLGRFRFVDRADRSPDRVLELLMVGRLVPKKGHRFAIAAVDRLIRSGVHARLTIVGDGPLRESILDEARHGGVAGHVDLVGATDHAGVLDYLNRADLFIHCSATADSGDVEGLGNAIIEAAATGLPIVATRHGGIAEVVQHQVTGLLVEEGDATPLADAIRSLATDPERRLQMGTAAHELARSEFDLKRQVDLHLQLYHEVMDELPPEAPRMRRTVVDDRFFAGLRRVFRGGAGYGDVSPIELVRWRSRHVSSRAIFRDPRPDRLESAWAARRLLPGVIRNALKRVLERAVHRRSGSPAGRSTARDALDPLRRTVHEYIDAEGSLSQIEPSWTLAQLAGYLSRAVSRRGGGSATNDRGYPA